ncbi:MAG: pseudouridine synthase [Litorilituus sp.]|jgi:tRNA pseudouridine65 synthase|nr:pseudouridine synthase [Litorilituus sp.]
MLNLQTSVAEKPLLNILYQDDYVVAVDKPAGLFVHRSFMDKDEIYFALQLVRDQIGKYVYPVHRLDRPTSGVLLFALTKRVAQTLNQAFAQKSASANVPEKQQDISCQVGASLVKTYYALVRGHLPIAEEHAEPVLIDYPLKEKLDKLGDKHVNQHKAAQSAQTHYQVIRQASLPITVGKFNTVRYSLVMLTPITGRRHQIRRHLAHLRHPIIGDINYGDNKQNPFFAEHFGFKRLMLIAKSLRFKHPVTEKITTVRAPFDQQWQQVFAQLQWQVDD